MSGTWYTNADSSDVAYLTNFTLRIVLHLPFFTCQVKCVRRATNQEPQHVLLKLLFYVCQAATLFREHFRFYSQHLTTGTKEIIRYDTPNDNDLSLERRFYLRCSHRTEPEDSGDDLETTDEDKEQGMRIRESKRFYCKLQDSHTTRGNVSIFVLEASTSSSRTSMESTNRYDRALSHALVIDHHHQLWQH